MFLTSVAAASVAVAQSDSLQLQDVVVTGTRHATDIRHLPMTVTVIDRQTLTEQHQPSVLPTVVQQVPSLFVTSRGMMGYGVSTGAAGSINFRGISSGSGQMLVLIDGHPQYQGVYGHSLADSYLTLMTERVEVLRGPASVLYGSNAMGGVMNIVTRKVPIGCNSVRTNATVGAGSWGTVQAEAANQVRMGKFSSTVAGQYGRSDNHRPNMGFEQYGGYLKLGYDINENWSASLSGNVTHWNASNPGTTTQLKLENEVAEINRLMAEAANNYDGMSDSAVFVSDYKDYEMGGKAIGIGSLDCKADEADDFVSRMLAVMPAVLRDNNRDMLFAKIDVQVPNPDQSDPDTPYVDDGLYFIYYGEGAQAVAEAIFGPSLRPGVTYSKEHLSRKQIVPKIMEILQ